MSQQSVLDLFTQARSIDRTLKVLPTQVDALQRRRLRPEPFSRERLFSKMEKGEPVLFTDLKVPVKGERAMGVGPAVMHALTNGAAREMKIRTRCGPSATRKFLTVGDLVHRWTSGRGRVSVTDLHIRGTNLMRLIDCSRLSEFNLLAGARGDVGAEEMLTMVISSAGTFSDSHTDDPDGSNHCFVGKKLWLVWDTFEGLSRRLEDVERCEVTADQAHFDMSAFLAVPHSRWFTIEAGQTLFLPGHLTHKVVTLENYVGIGSFFVMLPSYVRTLARWTQHTPLWALNAPPARRLDLVDRITKRVIDRVQALADASEQERARWGVANLNAAVTNWERTTPIRTQQVLRGNPVSADFLRRAAMRNS